jgi:hypothetical protein
MAPETPASPKKPQLSERIFWDVNFEALDFTSQSKFIIERVFERGDVNDIRLCRRYYGDDRVAGVLLKASFLPLRRLHLAAAVINKPITAFRCYTLRQSHPGLFPY